MVERPLIVRRVLGTIPHGEPTELFVVQSMFHHWCNTGPAILYVGMVHVKDPLLLIGKGIPCSGG